MSPDKQEKLRQEYLARWEAIQAAQAKELAAMTDEQVRQIIPTLSAPEPWRMFPDWSGLVEQQAMFMRGHK